MLNQKYDKKKEKIFFNHAMQIRTYIEIVFNNGTNIKVEKLSVA